MKHGPDISLESFRDPDLTQNYNTRTSLNVLYRYILNTETDKSLLTIPVENDIIQKVQKIHFLKKILNPDQVLNEGISLTSGIKNSYS